MALEKTDNGGVILDFLVSAVKGEFPDFKPNHKLEAARLLEKFTGVKAQELIDSMNLQPPTRRERRDARRADRRISSEIAQIAQEKTDNGRTIVEFLHSAMQGELPDFKPHHRMSASRELLHCVFDFVEEDEEAEPESKLLKRKKSVCAERTTSAAARKPSTSACTDPCTTGSIPMTGAPARTGVTTARATS